jgi:hypothetical protein
VRTLFSGYVSWRVKFHNIKTSCEPRFGWFPGLAGCRRRKPFSLMFAFSPHSSRFFTDRWPNLVSSFHIFFGTTRVQFLFRPRQAKIGMCVLLIWHEAEMSGFCICTIPPNYYGSCNEWLHPNPEGRVIDVHAVTSAQPNNQGPFLQAAGGSVRGLDTWPTSFLLCWHTCCLHSLF